MDDMLNSLVGLLCIVICLVALVFFKRLCTYIKSRLTAEENEALDELIKMLVIAAEQMFKEDDIGGGKRLDYVQGMLIEAGYDLTDIVRAKIEKYVYQINQKDVLV